ncbi:hypothetical protein [Bordetella bronchialis]|uniref:Uncharacterized protein n=2 Tax=Bordetella bronchialis TaxID=463025 RepID=A0A193FUV6_9BORD|nr:hypothetical protein [Bordetella bronchialis]ANN71118.1 hypothetical protein BAU08_07010 [Bordetella bronchialis]
MNSQLQTEAISRKDRRCAAGLRATRVRVTRLRATLSALAFLAGSAPALTAPVLAGSTDLSAQNGTVTPDDYFHTGAGSRYLRRADSELVVQVLRGNLAVLMGSGGNITVLSGKDGMLLVDAGIGKSLDEIVAARPTAPFDAQWGNFVFNGDQFTRMVYAGPR